MRAKKYIKLITI